MMNVIRNSSKVVMWVLVLMICFTGCKSKKKAAEAARAAEERARIEQEAKLRSEEEQRRKEAEEQAQREAEARRQQEALASAPKARLGQYFESITRAGNAAAANSSISEALTLFSSPDTPVLIVISEENGMKDYDRPTTIRQYLNYLKDTRNNSASISTLQFDNSGKITEVELRKKN